MVNIYPAFYLTFFIVFILLISLPPRDLVFSYYASTKSKNENKELFGNYFPPIKIYCYNISERWRPETKLVKDTMYYTDSKEFQFYVEIEMHNELLLSPLITNNPEEADFFYIPIHPFACRVTEFLRKNDELIKEIRSLGPWYDRKKGSDHIVVSGFEAAYGDSPFSTSITKDNFIIASPNPQRLDSWRTWHGQRNIIIPFVSHFKNFTFSDVNWTRKRNNTVYLAHSYNVLPLDAQALRKKVTDAVSKIKRKELIVFTRRPYRVVSIVRSLPEKMTNADFCVCVRGDLQLPNKRVFDAINLGCIPVLISDNVSLPFAHNLLDYSKFTIRIPEKDVDKIPEILESYSQSQIQEMRNELKKAAKVLRFRVGQPPVVGEAFWAFSWMLYIRHMYKLQYDGIFYPAKLPNYKKI